MLTKLTHKTQSTFAHAQTRSQSAELIAVSTKTDMQLMHFPRRPVKMQSSLKSKLPFGPTEDVNLPAKMCTPSALKETALLEKLMYINTPKVLPAFKIVPSAKKPAKEKPLP